MRRLIAVLLLCVSCAPPPAPMPPRPLTALEQCRADVAAKRRECNGCWFWLLAGPVGAGICFGLCGGAADALERECIRGAFATERN